MKFAHRSRLLGFMKDLDRINLAAWSLDYNSLRSFMHGVGATAFVEPILHDLRNEGLVTFDIPLKRGAQIYFTPKWRA